MTIENVDPRILDKLQGLLNLKQSPNEHEATLAAERAAELMARHGIQEADLQLRTAGRIQITEGRIDAAESEASSRVENWHKQLHAAVADVCGGRAYMHGRGRQQIFFVVGTPDTVKTAAYMYQFLVKQIGALSRAATRERGESNAWRRAYAVGMVSRVYSRLQTARDTGIGSDSTSLVLVDKRRQAVDDHMSKKKLRSSKAGSMKRPGAASVGYVDGDRIDIGRRGPALTEGQKTLNPGKS